MVSAADSDSDYTGSNPVPSVFFVNIKIHKLIFFIA